MVLHINLYEVNYGTEYDAILCHFRLKNYFNFSSYKAYCQVIQMEQRVVEFE